MHAGTTEKFTKSLTVGFSYKGIGVSVSLGETTSLDRTHAQCVIEGSGGLEHDLWGKDGKLGVDTNVHAFYSY